MCGIVGVYNSGTAAEEVYYGLYALQHRGQESAGIASANEESIYVTRGSGEVSGVFEITSFVDLPGQMALGQVRYSTMGGPRRENQQPIVNEGRFGKIALVHNGNLTNQAEVRTSLINRGSILQATSDSELVLHLMTRSDEPDLIMALIAALKQIEGAYNFILMTPKRMIVVRDPHGFRPLSLAQNKDTLIVASETVAFDILKAKFIRDIEPGEIVELTENGAKTLYRFPQSLPTHKCAFELIYFSRPDSIVFGTPVHRSRKEMGKLLALEEPVDADIVVPVPDSGMDAAEGYAFQSGIPLRRGLVRNHYVGRSFIKPTTADRDSTVRVKLNPVRDILEGKRVILIDDSIVRGTTSRKIVGMVKAAGAREVHIRISSPPTIGPCYYGIDTPRRAELIAASQSVEEIRKFIRADSLAYLGLRNLKLAVGQNGFGYCFSCMTNEYPLQQDALSRPLERRRHP